MSKSENRRALELDLLERGGFIRDLKLQHPVIQVKIGSQKVLQYTFDFSYIEDGQQVYEEHKGFFRSITTLRVKLVLATMRMTKDRAVFRLSQTKGNKLRLADIDINAKGKLVHAATGKMFYMNKW
jgi:hypothetical protein